MRLIVDADPGIDDALALLYLAAQPELEIVAVGSIHGNGPAAQTAANAKHVLALAGLPDVPVAVGAWRPLAQPLETAEFVHGPDALGGHGAPISPGAQGESAAEQLVRLARANPGELTLLALGPLTNVALALLLEPDLPRLLRAVVVLGGAIGVPGNLTAHADANFYHDPEAADLVLGAGFAMTLIGLNVTEAARADGAWLDALSASDEPRAQFSTAVLAHYAAFYTNMFGIRVATLHDPLAAAMTVDPSLGTYEQMVVGVELAGVHTRGQTLTDLRRLSSDVHIASSLAGGRPPVSVAMTVDAQAFLDRLFVALTKPVYPVTP
ncbi:nucleoside hydrolase [Actinokineospora sp. NPDC004072]